MLISISSYNVGIITSSTSNFLYLLSRDYITIRNTIIDLNLERLCSK